MRARLVRTCAGSFDAPSDSRWPMVRHRGAEHLARGSRASLEIRSARAGTRAVARGVRLKPPWCCPAATRTQLAAQTGVGGKTAAAPTAPQALTRYPQKLPKNSFRRKTLGLHFAGQ